MMAVVLGQSTFDAAVMGDNIEFMAEGRAVGYAYAINAGGNVLAAKNSGGLARTGADSPVRAFTSLKETEVSSVSKVITATGILHLLQAQPGGLEAALDSKLVDYLPSDWSPGDNVQDITLRHLLTHTSGFGEDPTDNAIGVDFKAYGNNNYANLKALLEAGLPPVKINPADPDAWPWGYEYNNANYTLLAKVVLPKLAYSFLDLTSANYPNLDEYTGLVYRNYMRAQIFNPLGITDASLAPTDANPTKGYLLATADSTPGISQSDLTNTGGAFGWKLNARELATFLDGIQHNDSILSPSTRALRNAQELGWNRSEDAFGEFFNHSGLTGSAGKFRSHVFAMPGDVEVAFLMNSEHQNLLAGGSGSMLKTAYVNAWTDLTVAGTPGADHFEIRLDNSGVLPSITVELNGELQFSHWISTLDSLTLNGGFGNDTFTIYGMDAGIDLTINGGAGGDVVHVLPGVRNIEMVSGMTFNGGTGADTIYVNDHDNPYSHVNLSRVYTVSNGAVSRFMGNPSFPGNPAYFVPVTVEYCGVENLNLTTGDGQDVVGVVSMTSGDTFLQTGAGNDLIVVGASEGNLEAFDGLQADGQAGSDTLRLFDHNKTSGDPQATAQYDVQANSVSRYMASLGGVSIGTPTPVEVEFSSVEALELTTTDLVDVIRVHSTPGHTTIHGGAGGDVLNVAPDAKNMALADNLQFFGDAGVDRIVINDQNNPYSFPGTDRIYEVTASSVSRSSWNGNPQQLPLTIDVSYTSVEDLTLRTGALPDVVNVESTPSAGARIETGLGNDVVHASPAAANMETVNGLQVDGGEGADSLYVHDEYNPYELPGGGKYAITSDSIMRYAEHVLLDDVAVPVELGFENVEGVSLAAGNLGDEFTVEGTDAFGTLNLDGNGGGDDFHVVSPAFQQIHIEGDHPILAPGDQLTLNEDGLYPVAAVEGLYAWGSGAYTFDSSTVSYTGIETTGIQEQLYNFEGDFDEDGDVDGDDLTGPNLGWQARYGHDLGGGGFLAWQRNLGKSESVRTRQQTDTRPSVDGGDAAVDYVALATWSGETDANDADAAGLAWEEPSDLSQSADASRVAAWDDALATPGERAHQEEENLAGAAQSESAWDAALAEWSLA